MMGLELIHVSKREPWWQFDIHILTDVFTPLAYFKGNIYVLLQNQSYAANKMVSITCVVNTV